VLEIHAGIGNLSGRLMARRLLYMAAEKDPLHLHALRNRFLRTPNVVVQHVNPEAPEDLAGLESCFDTVLCLNVLEYMNDPAQTIESLRAVLKPGGVLLILVPQGPGLFGTLDRVMGHKRRFGRDETCRMLEALGFEIERAYGFNKAGAPPWWLYSRLLGSKRINKVVLKIFDKSVWLLRRIDRWIPWPGLSLIVVARKSRSVEDAMERPRQAERHFSTPDAN
jgi:SAM-dependent methyltransferase